jgi:hypothetical protein
MAGAQAAHDHIEAVGKLRAKSALPTPAHDAQYQVRERRGAEQSDDQCLNEIAAPKESEHERNNRTAGNEGE